MFKGIRLKRMTVPALVFFAWFVFAGGYQFPQTQPGDKPGDKLKQGKESYEMGDYEKSITLLEQYIAVPGLPREKRAEAYYYLAKNYHAVNPGKVKGFLFKSFESDWFFMIEEKGVYFKKLSQEVRREFMEKIPVESYLEGAETAFERGDYEDAGYRYRVMREKLSARAFDRQVKKCEDARSGKQGALDLYRENRYAKAYIILKALAGQSPGDEDVNKRVNWIETQKIRPMIEAGDNYFNDKYYREAVPFFEKVLTFMPDNRDILDKLTVCRKMLGEIKVTAGEVKSGGDTIAKEGIKKEKKKKKFPLLVVILGGAAVGVILYFLLKKKKDSTPKTGSIKVESTPTAARVLLDGADTGKTTPAVLTDIQPGSHTVKLEKEGYLEYQVVVTVEANKETVLFAALTPAPTPNFVTNTETVTVPEGGQSSFQVKLSEQPLSDVSAAVSWISGDADITVISGENVTFTTANWNTYQAVTLEASQDDDTENGQAIFRISADGVPNKDIIAVEQDSGSTGALMVSPDSNYSPAGTVGGPFSPISKTYILQNIGTGGINWTVSKTVDWLTLSASEGRLEGGTSTTVILSLNDIADTLSVGTYTDTVLFINDTNGNGTTTRTVTLQISAPPDNPPNVTITSPQNGDTVSGTVTVRVDAADDWGIGKVEIVIDDSPAATLTTSPYTYQWDTTAVGNGSHTIKAIAYDTADQTADDQVGVTVGNSGTRK
jgi:tetratricopeptide (TPR) repeat protein